VVLDPAFGVGERHYRDGHRRTGHGKAERADE
jgi:hypothetical protein